MNATRLSRPLNQAAVKAANEALWRDYPELRRRPLNMTPQDQGYRQAWIQKYAEAGGRSSPVTPQKAASPKAVCQLPLTGEKSFKWAALREKDKSSLGWLSSTYEGKLAYVDAKGKAAITRDSASAEGSVEAALLKTETMLTLGKAGGMTSEVKAAAVEASGRIYASRTGRALEGEASATAFEVGSSVFVGDDPNNPLGELGGEVSLASAEAKAYGFIGDDGKRVGLGGGAKASASLASAEVKGERTIKIPFTDWTIAVRGAASPDMGGAGAGAEGHAYYDKEEKRVHLGAALDAVLGIGGSVGLDISIGKKYTTRDRKTDF